MNSDAQEIPKNDHLKHLRELSKELKECAIRIEANWRLQILWLAFGIAIILGWDAQVLKSAWLDASSLSNSVVRIVSRIVVSLLLLYYFFQFGILLREYREKKISAGLARLNFCSHSATKHTEKKYTKHLDSTHSQFEFFFRPTGNREVWGVILYLSIATGSMHGIGSFLVYDISQNIYVELRAIGCVSFLGLFAVVYWAILFVLYFGHLNRLKKSEKSASDKGINGVNQIQMYGRSLKASWLTGVTTILVFGFLVWQTGCEVWPSESSTQATNYSTPIKHPFAP